MHLGKNAFEEFFPYMVKKGQSQPFYETYLPAMMELRKVSQAAEWWTPV